MSRRWPEQAISWLLVVATLAVMLLGPQTVLHTPGGLTLTIVWLLMFAVAGWFDPPYSVAKDRLMRRWGLL